MPFSQRSPAVLRFGHAPQGLWAAAILFLALCDCGCGGGVSSAVITPPGPVPTPSPPPGGMILAPTSVDFGSSPVGTTTPAQSFTLTNNGTAEVAISAIAASGDFGLSYDCGSSLAAGGSCTLNVRFSPSTAGPRPGTLQVTDSAASSPQIASLNGTGVFLHKVTLAWDAPASSTPPVIGYFAYHGTQSGGPYTLLNSVPIAGTNFVDSVMGGQAWYFIVTSVDASLVESVPSNEVVVTLPP